MKITFLGAGSTIFAKNVLGDCILTPELSDFSISLHDIDEQRLNESYNLISTIAKNAGRNIQITKSLNRKESLKGSNYVVNAIQVGGYDPCTITDFEIPKKFGLRQTIADTLGIGGIFRALRTIPVMEEFARDIEEVCPDALLLNYTNPMSMLTGFMQRYTKVKTVGLCHSVQGCVPELFRTLKLEEYTDSCVWKIAGINHQAWLLEVKDKDGNDLYPEIKRRIEEENPDYDKNWDLVRHELVRQLGYYVTESSEHSSEYMPFFIKDKYPELIERFNIPLDEYPRRCINQIAGWAEIRDKMLTPDFTHEKSHEYASYIIKSMHTNTPFSIHGNVLNNGLITNLPQNACVEVQCMVDGKGITPCYVGDLPEICAAMNRTNINVQLLTIEAAVTKKKAAIYQAAMMDPHTAAELSIDDIRAMCDELIEAHGDWLPKYN